MTASCHVCGRWNDPTGGPDAHSGGCPNAGQPYERCQHVDQDMVRCSAPATVTVMADIRMRVCAADAPYYDPIEERP